MCNNECFIAYAEQSYKSESRNFGFAFWKYRELIKKAEVYKESLKGVPHYYAVNKNRLVYYWSDDSQIIIPKSRLLEFDLLYLHSKFTSSASHLDESHDIFDGNALIYDFEFIEEKKIRGYYADSFNFDNPDDYDAVSYIISNSAEHAIHMSAERIKALCLQPVFDPNLWIFIRKKNTKKPVAVGICVYDEALRETELEWIYVLKDYQGKGIGRALIAEIIKRAGVKSDIIRVGGVADGFYEKCGFTEKTDKWLWIKKKNTNVGWWE